MKKLLLALLVVGLALVAALQIGHAQTQQPAGFRIVIEAIPDGIVGTCSVGCAWNRVTYACGPNSKGKLPCKVEIDEKGIGGVK